MAGLIQRLSRYLGSRRTRVLGAVALGSLLTATAEFAILAERENQLVDRFSDSSWWMASQFRSEIQQLHISLATYDGSADRLDDVKDHYDIVYGRIATLEEAQLEPKPEAAFRKSFEDVRDGVLALAPAIAALKPGDVAAAEALAPALRKVEMAASHMTTLGAQEDAGHRGAVRVAIDHANVAFGLTELLLIASLLLTLHAVLRQAAGLDAARRRSEALSAELTVALAQAQAGARAKSAFLATMSHEIRTPMNGVLGAASLLTHTALTDSQRRWVEIVKACGGALLAQLDDVLDFSALEAEAVSLLREPVDPRALAEQTSQVLESMVGEKGLDLVVVVDPDVPPLLLSDQRRLGQVLLNLLTNAVKFTQSGGVLLRLSLRRRGATAWLRAAVEDTGPGIPRQDRRRIFEEFSRLDRPGERTVRGTGLGLAICRRIVTGLGGALRITRAAEGGSLFWLMVPVVVPPNAMPLPAPARAAGTAAVVGGPPIVRRGISLLLAAEGYEVRPAGEPVDLLFEHTSAAGSAAPIRTAGRRLAFGTGSPLDSPLTQARLHGALTGRRPLAPPPPALATTSLRLLVADDDAINREIEESLLRHLGHHVTIAVDGPEALSLAQAATFDCILLDLHMPGMDGADLARAIRRLPPPLGATRLVAVTADADAAAREAASAAGIDSVMIKPVTLERLAEALRPIGRRTPGQVAPGPSASGLAVVDEAARQALASRLPADRFAALVQKFWDELLRTLDSPGSLTGSVGDRRLHSLCGSAASLGYAAVAGAVRASRQQLRDGADAFTTLSPLFETLRGALQADAMLLATGFASRAAAALDAADAEAASASEAEPRHHRAEAARVGS
jgi:signal transduction histidine kinase/CheY-like chemotaxis protein